jgi:predicted dienelactone hydrolase
MKMNKRSSVLKIGIGILILSACAQTTQTPLGEVATSTSIPLETTEIPVAPLAPTSAPTVPVTQDVAQEPPSFTLSEPGPYYAGNRALTIIDDSRNGRKIELLIWYPAQMENDASGKPRVRNASADKSGAPYPLILTEADSGRYIFLSHLATYGFVMGVVRSPSNSPIMSQGEFALVNMTRDFLFVLDQIAMNPPEGLEGVIDTDRVGVTGFSYGGDISLALSGARIDPVFYRSQCGQISAVEPETFQWLYTDFTCPDALRWDEFVSFVGDEIITSDDGLWQPLTDERILAVLPMAPAVSWYFGERGLAAANRPSLILCGTNDTLAPYRLETVYTYEHLGTPDKYLISFIGRTHGMSETTEPVMQIRHFVSAFFGFYLQGREDYAQYFSEDFVSQFTNLFCWGVCSGED